MTIERINLRPQRRAPRGFTLAELIIGLLLLALIGGATAAVASAVSRGWQMGEVKRSSTLTITRTMLRVQDKIQRSKVMGQCRAGSVDAANSVPGAALLFWRDDANADNKMQLEETQLLEYDPAAKELVVHEIVFPEAVTRAAHNGPFDPATLSSATAISDYKAMTYRKQYTITRNVQGATFNVIPASSATAKRAQFEFRLKFNGPNGATVEYGTASPRSPYAP